MEILVQILLELSVLDSDNLIGIRCLRALKYYLLSLISAFGFLSLVVQI